LDKKVQTKNIKNLHKLEMESILNEQPLKDSDHNDPIQKHSTDHNNLKLILNELRSLNELQEIKNKYFEFYQNAPVGFFFLDRKGIIKDVNIKGAEMLDSVPEEMINSNFIYFVTKEYQNIFTKNLFENTISGDQSFKIDLKKDNSIIHVNIRVNQLLDKKTNDNQYNLYIDNITKKEVENDVQIKYNGLIEIMKTRINELLKSNENLEKRLEKNELSDKNLFANKKCEQTRSEEFERVLDALPVAVWISHDKSGRLITGNKLSYDYLDLNQMDNVSKSCEPCKKPVTFKIFKDSKEIKTEDMPVQLSSRGYEIRDYEFDFVYPDKRVRHMIGNATPLYDENKNPRGSVSAFMDVSKTKEAEIKMKELLKKLERSNKELEQFAYVTSHDLKEPLRMVSSFTQLLNKRYKGRLDQDADEFIEYIVDGTYRMQKLLDDLLEYARINTETESFESVDLEEIMDEISYNLKVSIEECNVLMVHDPLPTVIANRTHMIQLFQNLISNAIKFQGKKNPFIQISVKKDGNKYLFTVKDNGIGISPKFQEQIFKVFNRLHTTDEYPGTGIGLSITKKIVQYHNGNIWVKSNLGEGSTFYFTLPIKNEIQI
jgi:chemotaxis family two-component system sensor kinase Cph1